MQTKTIQWIFFFFFFPSYLVVELKVSCFLFSAKLLQGTIQAGKQGKCLDAQSKYVCAFVGFFTQELVFDVCKAVAR